MSKAADNPERVTSSTRAERLLRLVQGAAGPWDRMKSGTGANVTYYPDLAFHFQIVNEREQSVHVRGHTSLADIETNLRHSACCALMVAHHRRADPSEAPPRQERGERAAEAGSIRAAATTVTANRRSANELSSLCGASGTSTVNWSGRQIPVGARPKPPRFRPILTRELDTQLPRPHFCGGPPLWPAPRIGRPTALARGEEGCPRGRVMRLFATASAGGCMTRGWRRRSCPATSRRWSARARRPESTAGATREGAGVAPDGRTRGYREPPGLCRERSASGAASRFPDVGHAPANRAHLAGGAFNAPPLPPVGAPPVRSDGSGSGPVRHTFYLFPMHMDLTWVHECFALPGRRFLVEGNQVQVDMPPGSTEAAAHDEVNRYCSALRRQNLFVLRAQTLAEFAAGPATVQTIHGANPEERARISRALREARHELLGPARTPR